MIVIDYYFSPVSPYAYLAGDALECVAELHGARIDYKPIDIGTVLKVTGGTPVAERHLSRQQYRLQDLARRARRAGLPMRLQPKCWPADPRLACCALIAAQRGLRGGTAPQGDVGVAARAMMRALWAEDKDIADIGVIAEALSEGGFPAEVLFDGAAAGEIFVANTEEAVRRGVFGSPFYIVGGEKFWGQDRIEDLALHLAEG